MIPTTPPIVATEHRIKLEANENLRLVGSPLRVWKVTCRHETGVHYACLGRTADGQRWLWTNVTYRPNLPAGDRLVAKGVEALA